jgi:hypothetical protein
MEEQLHRPRPSRPSAYDRVFDPAPNRVLVFGTNLAGIHACDAAGYAHRWCGALWEVGQGLMGNSYAIPMEGMRMQLLKLDEVKKHVDIFIEFAWEQRDFEFFVTDLGCRRGRWYTIQEIAPLFTDAPPNCELPHGWEQYSSDESSDPG